MTPGKNRPFIFAELPVPAAFLLALVLSLLTSTFLYFLNTVIHINNTTMALALLIPVGISASLWGLGPGTISALASFLTLNYFFIPDLFSFQVKNTEDLVILVAFLGVAIVISELTGLVRRNLAAASDRENEAIRLYELNTILSGIQSEQAAVRNILEKIDQTLQPNRIEILVETPSKVPIFFSIGTSLLDANSSKPYIAPLQSARELIGEIRIWTTLPLTSTEERLLKIFANQSVLTIERLRLAEEAKKSRILEESDRLKTSLLSSVSHELRSPLATIKASVSSLRSGDVPWDSEARTELLTMVEEEIDHLNNLVGNLLDMSRIEAGVFQPQKKPNMLSEIIVSAIGRMPPQIREFNVEVDVSDELPLLNLDYVQIQQVFTNLFTNSLKYSQPGTTIRLHAAIKDPGHILVSLQNQSPPIPEKDIERIFDKFYRLNPSDRVTGSGLGLSICKGIIEAHGGTIWAENIPSGLVFKFILPVNSHG